MKISEHQVQQLIFYANLASMPLATLTEEGKEVLSKLVTEIINQQSDELVDIE